MRRPFSCRELQGFSAFLKFIFNLVLFINHLLNPTVKKENKRNKRNFFFIIVTQKPIKNWIKIFVMFKKKKSLEK